MKAMGPENQNRSRSVNRKMTRDPTRNGSNRSDRLLEENDKKSSLRASEKPVEPGKGGFPLRTMILFEYQRTKLT
ncbi:hypothetical protein CAEBREN_25875 [Caenorhabditis brenneri]|uniref:Uncharacterized protein n=1 Tax=Caenorhabditis brenneri TaxID=135651 RepID=G0M9P4_CAEBE|nr:hypothetical protein CAEBREN_25875 [Caenorhabditis brenneri]